VKKSAKPLIIVHKIAVAGSIDDSELQTNTVFLDVYEVVEEMHVESLSCNRPALILSMATVVGRSEAGSRGVFWPYKVVSKRVLMSVDLPRPDSPLQGK
jgi:hypothetical protein